MTTVYALPDTNIFLHYRAINEIDWPQLLRADAVVLIVPPEVIRQLNKIKDGRDGSKAVRKRAANAAKYFKECLLQDGSYNSVATIRDGVELDLIAADPQIDFGAQNLNVNQGDDWIIASALQFQQDFPDRSLVLISSDVLLQIKARNHRLRWLELPEGLRLPSEPDPEQKEIQELKQELGRLKNIVPSLEVRFEDGTNLLNAVLVMPKPVSEAEIADKLEGLRQEYPKASKPDGYSGLALALGAAGPADIDHYNEQLESFYKHYGEYYRADDAMTDLASRGIQLDFKLVNVGSAPANDIHISLHFPDGMRVVNELEDILEVPKKPVPPKGPMSAIEESAIKLAAISGMALPNLDADLLRPNFDIPTFRNVGVPRIRKTNSFEVSFHVRQLNHNFDEELGPLFIFFDSWETARSFTLDYRIRAANVPMLIEKQLHVVVECQPANS